MQYNNKKKLTKKELQKGIYIMAENTVSIKPGEKAGKWDRDTRVALVYSVLCALYRKSGIDV